MEKLLQEVKDQTNQLEKVLGEQVDAASSIHSNHPQWTSSTGWSVDKITARSDAIIHLAHGIAKTSSEKIMLVPTSRLIALRGGLNSLVQHTANFAEQLRALASWGGPVGGDEAVASASNGNTVQVRQLLDNIWNAQDNVLDARIAISPAVSLRGVGGFSSASKAISERALEAADLLAQVQSNAATVSSVAAAVRSQADTTEASTSEISRLQQEVEKRRRTIDDNASAISAALATVNEINARATALGAQVSELEPKIKAFDENFNSRDKNYIEAMNKLKDSTDTIVSTESQLKEITQKAKDVLGAATVAGLSKEYANQAAAVDGQLKNARNAYYISIALLVLSVIMSLGLLPSWISNPMRPMPEWKLGTPTGAYVVQLLGSLGSRILVILPAGLLAAFASTRHSALFRLREEYNHKKGLAASIDGFKEQAPDYAEAMAAAVFQELTKNPALAIEGNADHSPNGYLVKILQPKVRDALLAMLAARDVADVSVERRIS